MRRTIVPLMLLTLASSLALALASIGFEAVGNDSGSIGCRAAFTVGAGLTTLLLLAVGFSNERKNP